MSPAPLFTMVNDTSLVLPHELNSLIEPLLAVDALGYYRLFLLSSPLKRFDGQSLLLGQPISRLFMCFQPRTGAVGFGVLQIEL